jgi:hypothetical protein
MLLRLIFISLIMPILELPDWLAGVDKKNPKLFR